jgi:hypothetical protein
MINKILHIYLKLDKDGLRWREVEWDVKETSKLYILGRVDEYDGEHITRHLPKEEFGKLAKGITNPYHVEYGITCTEDKVEESKLILMEKVKACVGEFRKEIGILNSYLPL